MMDLIDRMDDLKKGDVVETAPLFRGLDPKTKIELHVVSRSKAGVVTFEMKYKGVDLVRVAGKVQGEKIVWTEA